MSKPVRPTAQLGLLRLGWRLWEKLNGALEVKSNCLGDVVRVGEVKRRRHDDTQVAVFCKWMVW